MKGAFNYLVILSIILPISIFGQAEICDNGLDDDSDGLIDLNDDDCLCQIIEPISLIPNPSFEEMACCPNDRSQLNCASQWIQASEATTDFIHRCGWLGWEDFPPPLPFPDGNGIMGFRDGRVRGNNGGAEPYWKEYAGACLISPLLENTVYRFQFDVGFVNADKSPPIDITFFGTNSCQNLPFGVGDDAFGCPTNSSRWKKLGQVNVSGGPGNKWINASLEITPDEDIYAIAIGPSCDPVSSPISIYYFFDNLLLADFESFNLRIVENQHPCSNDFTLSISNNTNFEYQWYKSGVALEGEVFSELTQIYGEGEYQVRILDGVSCRISSTFEYKIPVIEKTTRVLICDGDLYDFGDRKLTDAGSYTYTFKNINNCDSIVSLDLEIIGAKYDTLEVSILKGETYNIENNSFSEEGNFPLTLTSSIGCDSLVLLKLTHFDVFIPNVFSPNQDGQNDVFAPISLPGKIVSVVMSIYDRWGNLVHKGEEWDGSGIDVGVYIYLLDINFNFGKSKIFSGSVTVVR